MAKVTEKSRSADGKTVWLHVEGIGSVMLSRFSDEYDGGLYKARPWHIVSFGRNYPTVEDCVAYLRSIEPASGDAAGGPGGSTECEGSYLMTE